MHNAFLYLMMAMLFLDLSILIISMRKTNSALSAITYLKNLKFKQKNIKCSLSMKLLLINFLSGLRPSNKQILNCAYKKQTICIFAKYEMSVALIV